MNFFQRVKKWFSGLRIFNKSSGTDTVELNNLLKFLGIDRDASEGSLSEATYYACLKVLSEAIGKLPLKLLRLTEKNGVVAAREHVLYPILHERPNPYMTASTFWSTVEFNRNHYGNAYVWIKGAGANMTLWILPSDSVEVWYDDAKILADQPDIYYLYSGAGHVYKFGSEEILHFKTSDSFDGVTGISVRERLRSTIKGANKAQKMLNKLYDSSFTNKAVLQYTGSLNDENVKTFVQGIESYASGEAGSDLGTIIPIPVGATLTPLNMKLTDSQFLEIKQYTALQIASAFGIKPYQIGDYSKSSYASAEAQQLSFYVDTLLYILKQYEEELTYKLLSTEEIAAGYYFKFNVASILRADQETQIKTLSTAVNSFLYTPNEARALLDLEAKDGGDQLLGNGSSIPVQYTGAQYVDLEGDDKPEGKASVKELTDIIEDVRNGTLTYNQAVEILIYTYSLSRKEARRVLGPESAFRNSDGQSIDDDTQTGSGDVSDGSQDDSESDNE